jgi:hypothetical protein
MTMDTAYQEAIVKTQTLPVVATLSELLNYQGEDFVRCSYLTLVRREPDKGGMEFYLKRLWGGTAKIQILAELYRSPEAREKGAKLAGLERAIFYRALTTLPIIGRSIAFLFDLEGSSTGQVRLRSIEQQLHALGSRHGGDRRSMLSGVENHGESPGGTRYLDAVAPIDPNSVLSRTVVISSGDPRQVIELFRQTMSGSTELKNLAK